MDQMSDDRPDPSELLARVQREELRAGADGAPRGRLTIFFGMAPGVGKTYAMLAAAQRMAGQGVDVVVGVAETHGRAETEQLLLGLDILPRKRVEYKGREGAGPAVVLEEFDADAAIARRPDILVVDELAHTNAPGSGREKRWQDVRECLKAGVSVYTTLNVQHIESLNDVVAQITGVAVRETVPDQIVDEADEIELVDVPVEVLHERLRAGKVYQGENAARAVDPGDGFFRRGNLTALRELALRRTAAWVDSEMRRYKADRGIRAVWPAGERVLVAVSPSPMSGKLVRAAKRMAAGLHADLLAVYVETPRTAELGHADRERLMRTLRLAESLGASTTTLSGANAAHELIAFARSRNVARIVVGKTERSRLREAVMGSFVNNLIRESGDIDIYVIRGDSADAGEGDGNGGPRAEVDGEAGSGEGLTLLARAAVALGIVAVSVLVARLFHDGPDLSEESMVLLAGVIVAALTLGRWPAVLATVLSIAAFNFFFVEPLYTFAVSDSRSYVAFGVMLAAGTIIGTLAARSREQARSARDRERRTASLYAMTRELAAARDAREVAAVGTRHLYDTFASDVAISVPGPAAGRGGDAGKSAGLDVLGSAGAPDWFDERERSVARWVLDHGHPAGLGTRTLPAAAGRHVPLVGSGGGLGVLSLRPGRAVGLLGTANLLLLETLANQVATALERVALIESRQAARLEAERERLRSALLSSVSHDLRTPLASITGAASALEQGGGVIDAPARAGLLATIVDESARLSDLISNLVFATRLEAGGVALAREWTTVEEVVGVGLARHRQALASRPFRVHLPAELPMINVDNAMLPQVVHNLVENALRYTPAGTPISISAWSTPTHVIVKVADEGPGLAEDESARVFQRFYRGRAARGGEIGHAEARGGMGLGLTICEGIIRAHGGRIWAEPGVPNGVAFLFSLPIERPPPAPPADAEELSGSAGGVRS
ncbi:MAG: sensor histidine kinase KdpD [Phycisphaerales bacterium]|nr:sensor histidine kinase KdpD [Phycisphaerales bacterium]